MKRLLSTTAIALAFAGGTTLAVQAQMDTGAQQPQAQEAPDVTWTEAEGDWLTEDIIGAEVVNDNGDVIGEIDNLLITLRSEPEATQDDAAAPSAGTESTAPEQPMAGSGDPAAAGQESMPGASQSTEQMPMDEAAPQDRTAEAPTAGESIETPSRPETGGAMIADAVIGVGGFLGVGEKRVSVPFEELEFFEGDGGERKIVYNVTQEELEAMPEYQAPGEEGGAQDSGGLAQ